jgi:tetratricopeptide (TPR) repeat protein
MNFDPNNKVVKLCAEGMTLEGEGKPKDALRLFEQAWNIATDDYERYTAAHYVARQQANIADKLKWDETALSFALKISSEDAKSTLPSLYLNIAKGHEDLKDIEKAMINYQLAMDYEDHLPKDGYGNMIKAGIRNGMERVKN